MRQIVGSFGIDIHHASSLDGVDDGAGEFLRNSRTAEAASQTSAFAHNRRVGIGSSMHHNGTFAGAVVDTPFQPVEDEGVTVFSLIGGLRQVET